MSERPLVAYKILTAPQLEEMEARGTFAGAPVDIADGFIHLSTADQVDETLARHFAGQENLQIAAVDLAVLGNSVRWEPSRGGQFFPHVYGPLPLSAVLAYGPALHDAQGRLRLPTAG